MKGKTIKKKRVSSTDDYKSALIKKALGYDAVETVEEYAENDGEIVLTKKKVTTKNVPPDVTALKILLESDSFSVADLNDEELEKEKQRLLLLLNDMQKNQKEK